jgi:hypothetical protein
MTPTVREVEDLLADADHVDTKTAHTTAPLREFIAAALSGQSAWMRLLWRARTALAVALRLRDTRPPDGTRVRPENVTCTPGDKVAFFTVTSGEENRYLILEASDNHLVGHLAFVADPAEERIHAITVVRYLRWTGRVYFAIVRPFHHIIMRSMIKAATESTGRDATR